MRILVCAALLLASSCPPSEPSLPAIVTKTIQSKYQSDPVSIEVLAPAAIDSSREYPVVYILPVAPGTTSRWGSGIQEAAKADIANRFNVICVAPAFANMPWFADHPSDPALQQESHFIKQVLPWVEEHYPVRRAKEGRLLLGFSKSGYGAVMLLLRHPDLFERAVAWDAPLGKTAPDKFNMIDVFGTQENFSRYAIPGLLEERASRLCREPQRIFLMPDRKGTHPMDNVLEQLKTLGIPHVVEYTTDLKHNWESGWFPRAAELVITGR